MSKEVDLGSRGINERSPAGAAVLTSGSCSLESCN